MGASTDPPRRGWAWLGYASLLIWSLGPLDPFDGPVALWLPSGFLAVLLSASPPRSWLRLLGVAAATSAFVELGLFGRGVWTGLPSTAATLVEAALAGWALRRMEPQAEAVPGYRELGGFLAGVALLAPALGAAVVAAASAWGGHGAAGAAFQERLLATGVGMLGVVPVSLALLGRRGFSAGAAPSRGGESAGVAVFVAVWMLAAGPVQVALGARAPILFLVAATLLLAAAVRGGRRGAALASGGFALGALQSTALGWGPLSWVAPDVATATLRVQAFVAAMVSGAAVVAVALEDAQAERTRARSSAARAEALFHNSPVALFVEDLSGVRARVEQLLQGGVEDLEAHLDAHPEEVRDLLGRVRVVSANDRAVELYEAREEAELSRGLEQVLGEAALPALRAAVLALLGPRGAAVLELDNTTLAGRPLRTLTRIALLPGSEQSWERVLVSVEDLTRLREAELRSEASRKLLEGLVEHLNAGVVVHAADGSVELLNPRARELLGLVAPDGQGRRASGLWGFDRGARASTPAPLASKAPPGATVPPSDPYPLRRLLEEGEPLTDHLMSVVPPTGGPQRWLLVNGVPIRARGGKLERVAISFADVTELRRAELRLRESAAIFQSTSEGVLVTDLDGVITNVNPAFSRITGYSRDEALGKTPGLLSSGRHDEAYYRAMWSALSAAGEWRGEIWNRRKDGTVYPELLTISAIRDSGGVRTGFVAVFSDISLLRESQDQLDYLAHHDPLTDLPNRLQFRARLHQSIGRAERLGTRLAVIFLDVDRFKDVNDGLGHAAGDRLLQRLATRLVDALRPEDQVARVSGDEFVMLLDDIGHRGDAAVALQRIEAALSRPFAIDGRQVAVSVSQGVAIFPDDGVTPSELMAHADAAMHCAKDDGRATWHFYTADLAEQASEHLELATGLRAGLELGQLHLAYQPQVAVDDGRILGLEALLRWVHPERGFVSPARFIPVAEANGFIKPLGDWVLRQACAQGKAWLDAGLAPGRIAVNIAGPQLQQDDFAAQVQAVLADTGLPAANLELEVTEGFVMRRAERSVAQLEQLRDLGVAVSIDDFGTGYSSLSYLKRLPIDRLKIDQSFIRDIPRSRDDMAIAEAVIALGRALGLAVIAEGVETQEHEAFLREHGCGEAQGYRYSRPVPAEQAEDLLRRGALRPES